LHAPLDRFVEQQLAHSLFGLRVEDLAFFAQQAPALPNLGSFGTGEAASILFELKPVRQSFAKLKRPHTPKPRAPFFKVAAAQIERQCERIVISESSFHSANPATHRFVPRKALYVVFDPDPIMICISRIARLEL
jgi:hypothetical protein